MDAQQRLSREDDADTLVKDEPKADPSTRDSEVAPDYLMFMEADTFGDFQRQVAKLEDAILALINTAKQLHGSTSTTSLAKAVASDLANLLHTVRENAVHLCPGLVHPRPRIKHWALVQSEKKLDASPAASIDEERQLAPIVGEMERLAEKIVALLDDLTALSQFEDREIQIVFRAVAADLQYWASCLQLYQGRFEEMAIRRYVNDLTPDLCKHIESMISSLSYFIETGIPMVAIAQHHDPANIQSLTTVATFFSAVTATTLQFTFSPPHDTISSVVNGFWFSSLVFSVASTVNLLLGALLMRVLYRTPVRVPRLIYVWLYGSPLLFLVIAVACFSIGLAAFAYSSHQHHAVSTVTTAFSAFTYMGVVVVLIWFALARLVFLREGDALQAEKLINAKTKNTDTAKRRSSGRPTLSSRSRTFSWQGSVGSPDVEAANPVDARRAGNYDPSGHISPPDLDRRGIGLLAMFNWATAIPLAGGDAPQRLGTHHPFRGYIGVSRNQITSQPLRSEDDDSGVPGAMVAQDAPVDKSGVRNVAFSPDGKLLAVCGGEVSSTVWRVGDTFGEGPLKLSLRLSHPAGPATQVAWSPNGMLLITKLKYDIMIWSLDGSRKAHYSRRYRVKSVVWLPSSEAFLSLEGHQVVKMSVEGNSSITYPFEGLTLRSIAVPPQEEATWFVGAGYLMPSPEELQPVNTKTLRFLIVYDRLRKKTMAQIPLFNDVDEVTLADSGRLVLVSFKDEMPTQLWEIDVDDIQRYESVPLVLSRVYASKTVGRFSRLTCFGGNEDQFVLCTEKDGCISIFNRNTNQLSYRVPWNAEDDGRRCIAWNRAASDTMVFATGSREEGVKLWVALPRQPERFQRQRPTEDSPLPLRAPAKHMAGLASTYSLARRAFRESGKPANEHTADPLA